MPIYEFQCSKCGQRFEELILRKDEIDELVCPACGDKQVSRLLSTTVQVSSSKSSSSATSASCGPGSFS